MYFAILCDTKFLISYSISIEILSYLKDFLLRMLNIPSALSSVNILSSLLNNAYNQSC